MADYQYTHVAGASEPTSYTFTVTSGTTPLSAGIADYTGVDNTNPINTSATATANDTTSITAPSVTTTTSGTQLVALYSLAPAATATLGAGLSTRWQTATTGTGKNLTAAAGDQPQTSAGASPALTATTNAASNGAVIVFALSPTYATTIVRYGYTGPDDTPELTLTGTNQVLEREISLLGGVNVTKRGTLATDVWSYPAIHGDTAATCDGNGIKTGGSYTYDPYGNALNNLPDNSAGNYDYGWLGKQQRGTDHTLNGVPLIEMGARLYVPALGRFLQVDPIQGGSANNYD